MSVLIFYSLFHKKIYEYFPYIQPGYKLGLTLLIMSSFTLGTDILDLRSILTFLLLILSIIYILLCLFNMENDTIQDIIIKRDVITNKTVVEQQSAYKEYDIETKQEVYW